jgi:hypothetical protein
MTVPVALGANLTIVLLSPNVLYFSPMQIMFFGGNSVIVDGGVPEPAFSYRNHHRKLGSTHRQESKKQDSTEPADIWNKMVSHYSNRRLSIASDKLLAFSAIAEAVGALFMVDRSSTSVNYLAGLWEHQMPLNLLWYTRAESTHPRPKYRAPSWSWASVDSFIKYDEQRYLTANHPSCFTSKVLQVDVQLATGSASYGRVVGGTLNMQGLLKHIPEYEFGQGANSISLRDSQYRLKKSFPLDAEESDMSYPCGPESGYLVYVLCLIRMPRNHEEMDFRKRILIPNEKYGASQVHSMYGLILRKKAEENTYTRIGRFLNHEEDPLSAVDFMWWQNSFEMETVTII